MYRLSRTARSLPLSSRIRILESGSRLNKTLTLQVIFPRETFSEHLQYIKALQNRRAELTSPSTHPSWVKPMSNQVSWLRFLV